MKKWLAIIISLVIAVSVFTGCTKASDVEATTEPTVTTTTFVQTTVTQSTPEAVDVSPMLWKASDENGHTLYLFGTIHVGDERNSEVLSMLTDTLSKCDALAVEFDSKKYQSDYSAIVNDLKQYVYTDGTSIKDHMPEDMYNDAKALLVKAGIYVKSLDYYNIALWQQYIEEALISITCDLVSEYGMDSLLIDKAYEDGMEVLDVESAEFQMKLLNSFSDELNLMLVQQSLDHADEYGDSLYSLYYAWLSGIYDDFTELIFSEFDEDDGEYTPEQLELLDDYNKKLLFDRNEGMAEKAVEYIDSGKTVFFAVGAAHMVGEYGIIEALQGSGYTVERIYL